MNLSDGRAEQAASLSSAKSGQQVAPASASSSKCLAKVAGDRSTFGWPLLREGHWCTYCTLMWVVSQSAIRRYTAKHPAARAGLSAWLLATRRSDWQSIRDVRGTYPHADAVEGRQRPDGDGVQHRRQQRPPCVWRFTTTRKRSSFASFLTHAEHDRQTWEGEALTWQPVRRRRRRRSPTTTSRWSCASRWSRSATYRHLAAAHRMIDELSIIDEDQLTAGQADYLAVLSDLTIAYEAPAFEELTKDVTGLDMLKHMMEEHGLTASDVGRIIGQRELGVEGAQRRPPDQQGPRAGARRAVPPAGRTVPSVSSSPPKCQRSLASVFGTPALQSAERRMTGRAQRSGSLGLHSALCTLHSALGLHINIAGHAQANGGMSRLMPRPRPFRVCFPGTMGRQWLHAKRLVSGLKKAKTNTKLVREITLAAKMGDPDPAMNARLFAAVEKAKKESVPQGRHRARDQQGGRHRRGEAEHRARRLRGPRPAQRAGDRRGVHRQPQPHRPRDPRPLPQGASWPAPARTSSSSTTSAWSRPTTPTLPSTWRRPPSRPAPTR